MKFTENVIQTSWTDPGWFLAADQAEAALLSDETRAIYARGFEADWAYVANAQSQDAALYAHARMMAGIALADYEWGPQ